MQELIAFTDGFPALMSCLEHLLGVSFDAEEVTRSLDSSSRDSDGNVDASAKQYEFCAQPEVTVLGRVDEHEPETVYIDLVGQKLPEIAIREVFDAYSFAFGAGASFRTLEESLKIFKRSVSQVM